MTKHAKREAASPERPERWLTRPASGDAPEDRVASLMRAGDRPDGLAPAARARIWARLDRPERSWRPLSGLRWGVAMLVLLASAGVVAGVTTRRWWPSAAPSNDTTAPKILAPRSRRAELPRAALSLAEPSPAASRTPDSPTVVPAPAAPSASRDEPAFAPAAATAPAAPSASARGTLRTPGATDLGGSASNPAPSRRRAEAAAPSFVPLPSTSFAAPEEIPAEAAPAPAPAAPQAVAAPSALAFETPLLGEALTRLRQQRDARGALAALDLYDARFPRGTLRREANGARVDALLMLGRDGEALSVLRQLTLEARGRDQELRVVRAELSAATSCAEAVDDFGRVLTEAPPSALAERALYGRATCLVRLGDAAGAQRDLREYLRRFPAGRFADEARRALDANNL